MTAIPTSAALDRAADLLQREGWHGRHVSESPYCAGNAIFTVCGERDYLDAQRALWTYLGGESLGAIWAWNDAPDRTQAEVIETLRAAAVIEAARERATHPALDPAAVGAVSA